MSIPRTSPNHALQRTAPGVTVAASTAAFPPAMQVPRRAPRSLSLGSLAVSRTSLLNLRTNMKIPLLLLSVITLLVHGLSAAEPTPQFVEHISMRTDGGQGTPAKLKKNGLITTKATFKPPVEIQIEAKTDSTNLRIGYAADQMIFNWERNRNELRVDGGPANGKHKMGAGLIPAKQYVTIRWLVTPKKQSVFVDGQLRFEHEGNYSMLDKPISVYSADSEVSVKSIKVKQLPPSTE